MSTCPLHCFNYKITGMKRTNYVGMLSVPLGKEFDRITRDLVWWFLRKKGVP